jgi:hypothetical protein
MCAKDVYITIGKWNPEYFQFLSRFEGDIRDIGKIMDGSEFLNLFEYGPIPLTTDKALEFCIKHFHYLLLGGQRGL